MPIDEPVDKAQPEAFRALLQGIGVIAGLTHIAFLFLFYQSHVNMLAYVNVGSVLSYVWVFMLARQGQVGKAWAVTVLEVLGHAILAVSVVGWDTGFHYYILLVIPVAVVSTIEPIALKAGSVVGVMATYLVLDVMLRRQIPPAQLPMWLVDGLHYFNVAGMMVIMLFLAAYYYHLINQSAKSLQEMATTDALTSLRNRRAIGEIILVEHQRVQREQQILSFILCDIDHFKQVNDTHGHHIGDLVLKAAAQSLNKGVRDIDYLARWGGEEFMVVLPHTDTEGARLVAERLRLAIAALEIQAQGHALQITLTLGVATMLKGESAEQTISRADAALYLGKNQGRNCVVTAP